MLGRLVILLIFAVAGCSTPSPRTYGTASNLAQNVSVQELLGNGPAFDGQEVRVIGVARFDFGYEGLSALYTSHDDLVHDTFSYVGMASVSTDLGKHKASLENLTGKFVLVEGVFHAAASNPGGICLGVCWPAGYLSDVHRAQAW